MKKLFALAILSLYTLYGILYTQPTLAASVGLAVTKNLFDISLAPGDTYKGTLTVFNQSLGEIPVKVSLDLWDVGASDDELSFVDAAGGVDPRRWFDFGKVATSFTLAPNGDQNLPFTVTPPANTPAGSYFVMMRFTPDLPEAAFEAQGPRFIPELGVLFFVGVSPLHLEGERAAYEAGIASFTPQGRGRLTLLERFTPGAAAGVYDELVRRFAVALENRGLYHFKAKGEVLLTNMLGFTVARFELPSRYLLPGHSRTLSVVGPSQASWWERYGHMGRYTARLTLVLPGEGLPQVTQASFWVFPWQLLLPLGAAAGVIVILHRRLAAAARAFIAGGRGGRRPKGGVSKG